MTRPDIGDMAPDFNLPANGGKNIKLSDLRGHPVVLYFYPKDDTSGCTVEAKDFTLLQESFRKLNVSIIGMSPDPIKKHEKFIAKHELDLCLVADENKETLNSYGVWVEKSMYGRKYMGVERTTLLIDSHGKIVQCWRKVSVPNHAETVLKACQALAES